LQLNLNVQSRLPVYGEGLYVRRCLDVCNHCRAIVFLIDKGNIGETYLVGGENPRRNLEVVHLPGYRHRT
jgi:dTDP-glucose 4,6-dehydratase